MRVGLFKSTSSAGRPRPGQANIRGKVISGPIPIPDPAEDDEFPMRTPGAGLATPLGNEGVSKLLGHPERSSTLDSKSISNPPASNVYEGSIETPPRADTREASETSGSIARRRTEGALRYSTVSTGTDTDQSRGTPQRKRSTLRTAIGRLFGRKKAASGLETHHETSSSTAQHRSDPPALGRAPTREAEPKRSASLPITEFDRALRSHSVGLDDILAIESARSSLIGEPFRFRRRAATTSSKLYVRRSRELDALVGLSPRPASTQGRSAQDGLDQSDPENIGRAITSDVLMSHRRSRSLSQLNNVADVSTQRDRKEEIRYWRESYDPEFQSPTTSSVALENQNQNQNDVSDHVTLETPEPVADDRPKTPPQPFDFGTLEGVKITQPATLEERVAALEKQNEKLEKLVRQLMEAVPDANRYQDINSRAGDRQPRAPSTAYTTSTTAPGLYRTATHEEQTPSKYLSSRQSNDSFGDGLTFIGSTPPVPISLNRPTSTATVRGIASLPTMARESMGNDRYTNLVALLETERAARQYLEAQVSRLTQKLHLVLQTPRNIDVLSDHARMTYSVFEHDDDEDDVDDLGRDDRSESQAFQTPREERLGHGFGAFGEELIDDDLDGSRKKAARTLSLSQLTLGKPRRPASSESGVEL